jgi:hypothetical protein
MTIDVVYWFMDELPYKIQYFCPDCGKLNYDNLPDRLDVLPCRKCGMVLDCTQSEIRLIQNRKVMVAPPPQPLIV